MILDVIKDMKTTEEEFELMLEQFYQIGSNFSFSNEKAKCWNHFKTLKLPSKKTESYRYVPLRKLYEKQYQRNSLELKILKNNKLSFYKEKIEKTILEEAKKSFIVLINGHYCKELSNIKEIESHVVVTTFKEALKSYSSFLINHLKKTIKEEKDPFAALNGALSEEGIFIYLSPKSVITNPLHILNLIDAEEAPLMMNPRLQIFAGAESKAEIVSSQEVISGEDYFVNQVSDFVIEEKASIRYNQLLNDVSHSVWYLEKTAVTLKKISSFDCFLITEGSQTTRTDYQIKLTGENAEASLNALWMVEDKNQFHTHVLIEHEAPHCRSRQLFKGVLADFAKSSFEGKIFVKKAAQKTDAFQRNSNLLLSDHANGYSKPNLEIFADDVKASHGATFGQLDQEQLFFLKSRGIEEAEARNMLIFGFCKEMIDLMALPSLQNQLISKARAYHVTKRSD